MAVIRICGIVYQFKQAYQAFEEEQQLQYELLIQSQIAASQDNGEISKKSSEDEVVPGYTRELVAQFNSYVMDMCNFLYRNRAFNKVDKNARSFQLDQ